ncbi:hypothetical protein Tco_0921376 [Tanacetum coccineum]
MSTEVHQAAETVTTSNELDLLFGPLFDEYFNGENQVVLKSSAVTTTDASNKRQQQPDSTSSTSTLATTVTANRNFNFVKHSSPTTPLEAEKPASLHLAKFTMMIGGRCSGLRDGSPARATSKHALGRIVNCSDSLTVLFALRPFGNEICNPWSVSRNQSIKITDTKLPHHQRSLKSNKESSIGRYSRIRVKDEGQDQGSQSMNEQSHLQQEKNKPDKDGKLNRISSTWDDTGPHQITTSRTLTLGDQEVPLISRRLLALVDIKSNKNVIGLIKLK